MIPTLVLVTLTMSMVGLLVTAPRKSLHPELRRRDPRG